MTADRALRIGVVLEAFLDWPLDRVMPWLREHAPGAELYESTAEMLDHAALDRVLIAAPTDQHGAIIAEVALRRMPYTMA